MNPIRVLVVDDHAVLRAGLRMLLSAQADMDLIGEAADGEEALAKIHELKPDVVTLDLTMPGGGGLAILARLRTACAGARVLVLTMHDDPAYCRAVLAAGGAGYVVKSADKTELLSAIRAVHQGRTYLNVSLRDAPANTVLSHRAADRRASHGPPLHVLSQREREVLELAAQGHTNQQIADKLFLSVKTIETYRARLMAKLGLENRAELVRYAMETGLLNRMQPVETPG